MLFLAWLLLLGIIILKFMQVVEYMDNSLIHSYSSLLSSSIPLFNYANISLSIHLSMAFTLQERGPLVGGASCFS